MLFRSRLVIGDELWVSVDWAGRRLFARSPKEISDCIFTTVVFTDLSGSTETLNRLGDARWRLLLAEHNEAVRADIERFGGREMKTTGDGFFVLFDSPARAVCGAAAMLDTATAHGLTARAGIQVRSNSKATRCEASQSMPQRAFSARPAGRSPGLHHYPRPALRLRTPVRRPGRVRATRTRRAPQPGGASPLDLGQEALRPRAF